MAATRLQHPPTDAISQARFAPSAGSGLLLVSSWDAHVRLYDTVANRLVVLRKCDRAVLDCTFLQDSSRFLAVGLDCRVVACDVQTQQDRAIGQHDAPIRCVEFHRATMQVFTGSWDRTLRAWDPRQAQRPTSHVDLGAKVFCMDTTDNKVVVGGSDRNVHIYDLRSMSAPVERRDCILRDQIRAVKVSPDHTSYVAASVEGRVSVEYFDGEESQNARYAFKCHRTRDGANEVIHPVNAIAFHPKYGTFASGGSDGGVCVWDGRAKKRLWKMDALDAAVATLSFNADGSQLAVGTSCGLEPGDKCSRPYQELFVRPVADAEVMTKALDRGQLT